jgi:hypothetical protein
MLAKDPFMKRCIYDNEECDGRVEFEHALIYAGKQVVEWWSIVPVCTYHHRGKGLIKEFNQAVAFGRAWKAAKNLLMDFADAEYSIRFFFPKNTWPVAYLLTKYQKKLKELKLV